MILRRDILFSCLAAIAFLVGCGGKDIGPVAYEYAKALYAITSREAEDKLDQVTDQINASLDEQELTPREADQLLAIVDDARNQQWKQAKQTAWDIMEDQVQRK